MLELLTKIRSRKILFLLLIAPLFFTPVHRISNATSVYEGLTVGPQLAFPIGSYNDVGLIGWPRGAIGSPFRWRTDRTSPGLLFVDWGRILYWECWVLLTYFCIVPWFHKVGKRLLDYLRSGKPN
jgi:hypothetical protein